MTRTVRKTRSDSAAAAIEAAKNAMKKPLQPPAYVKMPKEAQPFWEAIIASRARMEWADADLVVAAQLARLQVSIEKYQKQADEQGPVIENARGTPVANPVFSALEQMARRQLAMLRTLTIGGSIGGKAKSKIANQRQLERGAKAAHDEVSEDDEQDLLA